MSYEAKVILDSISPSGYRLTTLQVTFPRIILAELNTHRVFSRNSASSRAIPVEKQLAKIKEDPFVPFYWGKNQKGMSAEEELTPELQSLAMQEWLFASVQATERAENLLRTGVHKQLTNRLLEPFMWHQVVITATEWPNFDALRDHPAAAPEIQRLARLMREARAASVPIKAKDSDYWHLPYVYGTDGNPVDEADIEAAIAMEKETGIPQVDILQKVSVGRCAAVSYRRHEERDFAKDVARTDQLRSNGHMSPLEHAARPMSGEELDLFKQPIVLWDDKAKTWQRTGRNSHFLGNYQGWVQFRKLVPNEDDFSKILS